jgi:hypothetical protein
MLLQHFYRAQQLMTFGFPQRDETLPRLAGLRVLHKTATTESASVIRNRSKWD